MAQCTSCWRCSFHRCSIQYIAARSAAVRDFKGPPATVVFLLVPPSESRSPPALITIRIERASHRSSSSVLLIFSSIFRVRARSVRFPAGRMTHRYLQNCQLPNFPSYRPELTPSQSINGNNSAESGLHHHMNIVNRQNHQNDQISYVMKMSSGWLKYAYRISYEYRTERIFHLYHIVRTRYRVFFLFF